MISTTYLLDRAERKLRRDRRAARKGHAPRPFDLAWIDTYLPHYVTVKASRFHRELVADLGQLHFTRGQHRIYRGPRGAGKTSYLSKAYPLWCALEGVEPLTLLLAETGPGQAESYLAAIRSELESNDRIRADYPHAAGVGPRWVHDTLELRNGCVIKAKGSGGRMLGMAHNATRPTLVIGDDLNARGDAYSPTTRQRRLQWFNTDVMSIGTLRRTNYVIAGTAIHRDAVVCALAREGAWTTRTYTAILEWPKRMDLWAEWERVYSNLADDTRANTSREFYAANRADMDAGAEVLWPDWESLYDLMAHRATIGPSAFDSEKQDRPGVDGATEFPDAWFTPGMMFDAWPGGLVAKVVACDPSKGADAKSGDWQAIASVALHSDGVLYADMSLKRESVPIMAERFALTAKEWGGVASMGIETNATLGLLLPEIDRGMKAVGLVCPCKGIYNTLSKGARIRRLGGWLSRGQLRIRNTPGGKELVEQLRQFPNGDHDDAADALEIGIRLIEELITGDR